MIGIVHPTDKANFSCVELGNLVIWFSYSTPIAFVRGGILTIRENDWSATTGLGDCYLITAYITPVLITRFFNSHILSLLSFH